MWACSSVSGHSAARIRGWLGHGEGMVATCRQKCVHASPLGGHSAIFVCCQSDSRSQSLGYTIASPRIVRHQVFRGGDVGVLWPTVSRILLADTNTL
jgi:hypothetical protein